MTSFIFVRFRSTSRKKPTKNEDKKKNSILNPLSFRCLEERLKGGRREDLVSCGVHWVNEEKGYLVWLSLCASLMNWKRISWANKHIVRLKPLGDSVKRVNVTRRMQFAQSIVLSKLWQSDQSRRLKAKRIPSCERLHRWVPLQRVNLDDAIKIKNAFRRSHFPARCRHSIWRILHH